MAALYVKHPHITQRTKKKKKKKQEKKKKKKILIPLSIKINKPSFNKNKFEMTFRF